MAGTKCIVGTLDNILVGGDGIHLTFYAFVHILGTEIKKYRGENIIFT